MSQISPQLEDKLRQGFKRFNPFMVWMWRLGLGRWVNAWPDVGGRIMVLTHIGRKSGLRRRTPVNYTIEAGDIYCTAGFGPASDWYRNLLANPQVEVWLPDGCWNAVAEDISQDKNRLPLLREVIIASGFAGKMAGLDALKMSDVDFEGATSKYCLLRIRRTGPLSSQCASGDLAWLWLPIGFMSILLLLVKLQKKLNPRP